ncbi:anthrone oxygenase family protein [Modestobacter sp. NPDC049651]|uniref:anthrone oxygenase family protein n=1 Tax=unclassified Modestobacter TaxID=2643866 RepID=UPI0033FF0715
MRPLVGVTAAGALLVSGAFLVFSVMVLPALRALSTAEGVRAMQSVNRVAVRPVFMLLLFGTAVLCVLVAVLELRGDRRVLVLAGVGLYLAGAVLVTGLGNVPLNDTLAAADPDAAGSVWESFLTRWTAWNTVRTVTSLAAGAALLAALADRSS